MTEEETRTPATQIAGTRTGASIYVSASLAWRPEEAAEEMQPVHPSDVETGVVCRVVTRRKSAGSIAKSGAISGIQASQSRFVHCLLIIPSLERELKSKTSRKEVLSIVVTSIRRGGPRFWAGRRQNRAYVDGQTQLNSWESRWPQNNGRCNHCPCLDKHGLDQRALIACQVVISDHSA